MQFKITAPLALPKTTITLPSSKSLSNRALILQALTEKPCRVGHISDCDDTRVLFSAFSDYREATSTVTLDIGAAGTSMRFLTAYLASRPEGKEVILTGSERMRQRPIALLVESLHALGANISYENAIGYPPLRIKGQTLTGGKICLDGSVSSQYVSALLMIAPTLKEGLTLTLQGLVTSVPYIEMTLGLMQQFGVTASYDKTTQTITVAPQPYTAQLYDVEGDWSAASYWYEIVALSRLATTNESEPSISLSGLQEKSLQGDAAVRTLFDPFGVDTQFHYGETRLTPHAVTPPSLLSLDLSRQPDLAQTVVVTACALGIPFRLSGLHTLRIKETDRIAALEIELRKFGFLLKDEEVALNTQGEAQQSTIVLSWDGTRLPLNNEPITVATYKDHRMAMAFAPLAFLLPSRSLIIDDPAVVSKSYPFFWDDLSRAGFFIEKLDR